jgi:hypothetical protein
MVEKLSGTLIQSMILTIRLETTKAVDGVRAEDEPGPKEGFACAGVV